MGDINVSEGAHKLNSSLFLSLIPNASPSLSVLDMSHCNIRSSWVLVKVQAIGYYSRCREFYDLGVGLRIFSFRLFPRQFLRKHTDVFAPFPKAFHVHSSCLSPGLRRAALDSSSCLPLRLTSVSRHVLLRLLMLNCHGFQTLTAVYLASLWSYEIFSLTLEPSHSHAVPSIL